MRENELPGFFQFYFLCAACSKRRVRFVYNKMRYKLETSARWVIFYVDEIFSTVSCTRVSTISVSIDRTRSTNVGVLIHLWPCADSTVNNTAYSSTISGSMDLHTTWRYLTSTDPFVACHVFLKYQVVSHIWGNSNEQQGDQKRRQTPCQNNETTTYQLQDRG